MIYINADEPVRIKRFLEDVFKDECEVKPLTMGDYLIEVDNRKVCIERKTATDYINSLIDGRLHRQLYEMSTNFPFSVLIITGDIRIELYNRKVSDEQIIGSIVSAALKRSPDGCKGQVIVLHVPDFEAFVAALKEIHKIVKSNDFDRIPRITCRKSVDEKHLLVTMLSSIPGVGLSKARNLIRYFGSMQAIANADIDELKKVSGIGPKIAEKIYHFFRIEY